MKKILNVLLVFSLLIACDPVPTMAQSLKSLPNASVTFVDLGIAQGVQVIISGLDGWTYTAVDIFKDNFMSGKTGEGCCWTSLCECFKEVPTNGGLNTTCVDYSCHAYVIATSMTSFIIPYNFYFAYSQGLCGIVPDGKTRWYMINLSNYNTLQHATLQLTWTSPLDPNFKYCTLSNPPSYVEPPPTSQTPVTGKKKH